MKTRHTLLLLGLFSLLLAAYYLFEVRGGRIRTERSEKENRLVEFSPDAVTGIEIRTAGGETLSLAREGTGWRIVKPIEAAADRQVVDRMLTSLRDASYDRIASDRPGNRSEFGLDPAQAQIALSGAPPDLPLTVLFGSKNPIDYLAYAAIPGDARVFMVDSYIKEAVDKDLAAVRERRLLAFDREEVGRITCSAPDRNIVLARQEPDGFVIERPWRFPADEGKASDLVFELKEARAESFLDERLSGDPARYGLDAPSLSYRIERRDGKAPLDLRIGKADENGTNFFAEAGEGGPVVLVSRETIDRINVKSADLRSRKLAEFYTYQVDRITLASRSGPPLTVERTAQTEFRITTPSPHAADAAKVEHVLTAITSAAARDFIDAPDAQRAIYGLDPPAVTVTLDLEAKMGRRVFTIGQEDGKGSVYASILGFDPVLLMPAELAAALSVEPSAFYPDDNVTEQTKKP